MREIRLYGSEGGGAYAPPTPIQAPAHSATINFIGSIP